MIYAIIPARGGSKSIPRKNLVSIGGSALLARTIKAAQGSRYIDEIFVSTDDTEIASIAKRHGAITIQRPESISGDTSASEEALMHGVEWLRNRMADGGEQSLKAQPQGGSARLEADTHKLYSPDTDLLVFLQCTAPFTTSEDIDAVILRLLEADADSAFTCCYFDHFIWKEADDKLIGINHDFAKRLRRQDKEKQYIENGAVYVMKMDGFMSARNRFFGKTVISLMPRERCFEVDELPDIAIAEAIAVALTDSCNKNIDPNASLFSLKNKVVFITGGAGLLGVEHAKAVCDAGGIPIIADVRQDALELALTKVGGACESQICDVTSKESIEQALAELLSRHGKVDVLVNNAAKNPKVEIEQHSPTLNAFCEMTLADWTLDLTVGLTGAMLCSQVFGCWMASNGGGVILNIGSEYSLVAPNPDIYHIDGLAPEKQPSKPVSYTTVKHGIVGLTKHLAIHWAKRGVRVNCLCPGGVEQEQRAEFKSKITKLIPMGRMATPDHVRGALVFLCSDASAFMTGEVISVNGGRAVW